MRKKGDGEMCGGKIEKQRGVEGGHSVGGRNPDERGDGVGGNKRRIKVVIKLKQRLEEKDWLKVATEDRSEPS